MSARFPTSHAAGRGKYLRKHSDSLFQLLVRAQPYRWSGCFGVNFSFPDFLTSGFVNSYIRSFSVLISSRFSPRWSTTEPVLSYPLIKKKETNLP